MRKVLFALQKSWIYFSSPFRKIYTANICGHQTHKKGFMKDGNKTTIMSMPLADNGMPDYCLACIGNMSIRCAWCGESIIIGNTVKLRAPTDTCNIPNYAVSYTEGSSIKLIGCTRLCCTKMVSGDHTGLWLPGNDGKGWIKIIPTIYESLIANPHAKAVIVNNTRDVAEAMNPTIVK